jgi:hypothetical protein
MTCHSHCLRVPFARRAPHRLAGDVTRCYSPHLPPPCASPQAPRTPLPWQAWARERSVTPLFPLSPRTPRAPCTWRLSSCKTSKSWCVAADSPTSAAQSACQRPLQSPSPVSPFPPLPQHALTRFVPTAQDNPSWYVNPVQFEIVYECSQPLPHGASLQEPRHTRRAQVQVHSTTCAGHRTRAPPHL